MMEFKFKNPNTGKNESVHVRTPYRFQRFKVIGKNIFVLGNYENQNAVTRGKVVRAIDMAFITLELNTAKKPLKVDAVRDCVLDLRSKFFVPQRKATDAETAEYKKTRASLEAQALKQFKARCARQEKERLKEIEKACKFLHKNGYDVKVGRIDRDMPVSDE